MSLLADLIYRFNAIPIKIPKTHFVAIHKLILTFMLRWKRSRITNTILKKNKVEGLMIPNFKFYWKTMLYSVASDFLNPMDGSPPGSSDRGIFQARMLEWVAISYSGGSSQPRDWTCITCVACIGKWILLQRRHLGSLYCKDTVIKKV